MTLPSWSAAFLKARRSSTPILECLTFFHPMMETVRIVKNPVEIVSRGDTFNPSWFELAVINSNDQQPRASLTMPNLPSRRLGLALKGLVGPLKCTIELLSAAQLDEPFYTAAELMLKKIKIGRTTISGDLVRHDYGSESFGKILVSRAKFPSIYLLQTRS